MDLIGRTFTHRGLTLRVVGTWGAEYEVHSVFGPGVWFTSEATLRALLP